MKYTLGTAAKATGKSRTAILRAIKSGKISAPQDENGHYQIDPAELFRVYSAVTDTIEQERGATPEETPKLIEVMERERQQMQATIEDLRRRLDETEEARREAAAETRRLTLMLTHQPEKKPDPAKQETAKRPKKRGFLGMFHKT